jgi:hypothetical protein
VQEPDTLKPLIRLANLLPKSFRVATAGIHPLLARQLINEGLGAKRLDIDWEMSRLFYLQSYVNELPLVLQAFVLRDHNLRYVEMEPGTTGPMVETHNSQLLSNLQLLDQPERKLRKIVAEAKDRIKNEI